MFYFQLYRKGPRGPKPYVLLWFGPRGAHVDASYLKGLAAGAADL